MKFAFMSFSTPRQSLAEMLALAKGIGYDGIEPRVEQHHRHGIELSADPPHRRALRKEIEASGVSLASIATCCKYADPATTAANVELTRKYIDLASDLNCTRIRVFGGQIPPGFSHDQAANLLIDSLRSLGDYAAPRQITLCLETHDSWCDPAIVAFIMREVDHPAVGVNWDIMHTVRQGKASMEEAFRVLRPWIRHVHVHDGVNRIDKLRIVPIGTGELDHRLVLRLLKTGEFQGFVSGEWIESMMSPEFFSAHLPSELATLKRLASSNGTR